MNNWNIRKQILALALLPLLIVAGVLTSYFTITQLRFISDSAIAHATIIARQLAPVSEYAVFSGNIDSLTLILETILLDKDIVEIKITDADHNLLTSMDNYNQPKNLSIWHRLADEELTTFTEPIKTDVLDITLLDDSSDSETNDEIIGYAELTFTSININAVKLKTAVQGSLLSLIILIASAILALRLSQRISTPVKNLTSTVRKISSGDYETRINQQTPGDLGVLESCVNIMAEELQSSRHDLEAKVAESTKELHETMEELEIRNAELDIARGRAIQANKAKTEFLANMSHELRTPLGGILGFAELLESTYLESQQRDYSEIIKKSAHNLLHIIDDVLDISKIESGKLEIHYSEFNIIDVAEEVIDLLIPIAYEKNIELFYLIDEAVPRVINSDPTRIRQILTNLIGNAIKFTDEGYVSLHISSTPEKNSRSRIKFSVTDTGIGMDQSQQERLFKAFTQANESIARKFGGTGLGLVISKKLASLLHGDINFESQPNIGSTFILSISTEGKLAEHHTDPVLINKKICLIDPHKTFARSIQPMLDSWGCITSYCEKLPDTLPDYDLIVINICRADMHEEKIKSFIPENNSGIPLLAIVSTRSHKDLADIRSYGYNDAVFRSANREFIRQSIVTLIDHGTACLAAVPPIKSNGFDWTGLNILVVDDNDINLKLAEIILKKNNAQVTTAASGQQGIAEANRQNFDLIFMDLQMPDLDGYESSALIRKNTKNRDSIIIALTANAVATKDTAHFTQSGINDILVKPINENSVQNTINQWLLKNRKQLQKKSTGHEAATFSKSEARELAAGNAQLANELTMMLLDELPEHLRKIKAAFAGRNLEQLRQHAHKLHGASRCCGALALRHATGRLEADIDHNAVEKVEADTQQLCAEIEKLMASDKNEFLL